MAEKSKPTGFSKGLISDTDPRYQIEGSYRDAMNVKLVNSDGATFTIENINGNRKIVNLDEIDIFYKDEAFNAIGEGEMFKDRGDFPMQVGEGENGLSYMRGVANIVGTYSYKNQLLLIVTGYIGYGLSWGSQSSGDFRTAFFILTFDDQGEVIRCEDLRVAANTDDGLNYPNINMDPLIKCRVEGIIENEAISRVYWTDNKNPLRTFNLNDPDISEMNPEELDLTPKAQHNQGVVVKSISGNLPVGTYQYCYKYITETGSESGISPFSNLYHISSSNSNNYQTYSGSAPGEVSSDGFQIDWTNLDTRFDRIKVYALYWSQKDVPPLVGEVGTSDINDDGTSSLLHGAFTEAIDDGIAQILIPSNTWDVCKDIAIKDNVLFAANLRSKKNYVTEKEWNVKILRYRINDNTGSMTCNDPNIFSYYHPSITGDVTYDPDSVTEAPVSSNNYVPLSITGSNAQVAHRYLPTLGSCKWGNQSYQNIGSTSDRRILGGQSYGYYSDSDGAASTNGLGGVIVSFRSVGKVSDTIDNRGGSNNSSAVFFGSNTANETIQTDNLLGSGGQDYNVDTEYTATFNVGSNKDPHASGNKRGYQRGETYRFGVLVYDRNGDPGNVLWIGDIQMPEHHDKAWELDLENTELGRDAANSRTKWRENPLAQDYRMSAYGNSLVPGAQTHYDNTSGYGSTGYMSGNSKRAPFIPKDAESEHYTMDLAVDFTFKIPRHVREKISGFRVVRAERKETDRTILQSGLLNQIVSYGDTPKSKLAEGYVGGDDGFNHGFGTQVEAGDHATIAFDGIDEIFDQVLNQYCGLEATSTSAVGVDSEDTDGNKKTLYQNESDGDASYDGTSVYQGTSRASSGEFGSWSRSRYASYDDDLVDSDGDETGDSPGHYPKVHSFIQDKAAIMYSPDSAFGVRPYQHKDEYYIKNVSVFKLYDQRRHNNYNINVHTGGESLGVPAALSTHHSYGSPSGEYQTSGDSTYTTTIHPKKSNSNLHFSTRKETLDGESGVMVGKCYVYDTYLMNYMFNYDNYNGEANSSGDLYVNEHGPVAHADLNPTAETPTGSTTPSNDPTTQYNFGCVGSTGDASNAFYANRYCGHARVLANSKEIGPGEFVGKGFFQSVYHPDNAGHRIYNRGYSNFSLGRSFMYNSVDWGNYLGYGKVNTTDELSYETISTVQMGTRGILLYASKEFANIFDLGSVISGQNWFQRKPHIKLKDNGHINETKIPYYNYANICVNNIAQYGGRNKSSIDNTRWIIAGNFHPINVQNQHQHSTVFGGDTFVNLYSHQITTSPYPEKSFSKWIVFPVESYVNTDMRSGFNLGNNDHVEGFDMDIAPFSNDWLYNVVYSQENNLKSFLSLRDSDNEFDDLPNEIAYSKTKLSGEESDAFRVFPIFNFYDVEAIYGQINRIINYNNEIHFFQDKAFGQLLVNPRTFLQDVSGAQSLFTGSGDTIESHQYISVKYGTKHMHSVVASERNLYFFDINYSKFLKYGVDKKLVSISDDLGTRDLFEKATKYGRLRFEDRYSRADRVNINDMPLYFIGVHAAFDYFENTLYMTIADRLRTDAYDNQKYPEGRYVINGKGMDPEDPSRTPYTFGADRCVHSTTIAYNEDLEAVVSKYSVYPQQWIEHQGRLFTPKSRWPWASINNIDGYFVNGNRHNKGDDYSVFGFGIFGVYGDAVNFKYNPANYRYYSHELSEGPLELWQWNHQDAEKTTFFGDVHRHPNNDDNQQHENAANVDNTISLPSAYPVVFKAIKSGDLLDSSDAYTEILKLTDIGGESGTVDLHVGETQVGTYDIDNDTLTISTNVELQKGDLVKSIPPTNINQPIIHQSYVEKVINDNPQENKKFDNINIITSVGDVNSDFENNYGKRNLLFSQRGVQSTDAGAYFESLEFITDFTEGRRLDISTNDRPIYPSQTDYSDVLHKYREGILKMPLRYKVVEENNISNARVTGTYMRVKLSARTTEKFNIFAIMAKYRKSYN